MRVEIRSGGYPLCDEERLRMKSWIEMGLGRFGADIAGVVVHFDAVKAWGDEENPRCQIAVATAEGRTVVVDAIAGKLNRAAARAFLRAEAAVARALDRDPRQV